MGVIRRRIVALLLFGLAFQGGPVMALLEAWEHAHLNGARHGHVIHFESRGAQDHDDACLAWIPPAGKAPVARGTVSIALPVSLPMRAAPMATQACGRPALLPPSRAPPATA